VNAPRHNPSQADSIYIYRYATKFVEIVLSHPRPAVHCSGMHAYFRMCIDTYTGGDYRRGGASPKILLGNANASVPQQLLLLVKIDFFHFDYCISILYTPMQKFSNAAAYVVN